MSLDLDDFPDGTSTTVLVTETADSDIPWLQPLDLDHRRMPKEINAESSRGIGSYHENGANVVMADCACRFVSEGVDLKAFQATLTAGAGDNAWAF